MDNLQGHAKVWVLSQGTLAVSLKGRKRLAPGHIEQQCGEIRSSGQGGSCSENIYFWDIISEKKLKTSPPLGSNFEVSHVKCDC